MGGCSWFLSEYKDKMLNSWLIPDRHILHSAGIRRLVEH